MIKTVGQQKSRQWPFASSSIYYRLMLDTIIYGYAFLYMYTGIDKLQHLQIFRDGIQYIPYFGKYATIIGWGIPILEILLAMLLVVPIGRMRLWAIWGSTVLIATFTVFIGAMIVFAPDRLCHCGGVIASMGWTAHLVFNLVWLTLGIWSIIQYKQTDLPVGRS